MPTHYQGSESEKRVLDTYIKLIRSVDAVNTSINAHLRDYDLTVSQFGILEALFHLGSMHTGELGTKILKSSGNMTMVVDNLEKRGLVKRAPLDKDRRCINIHLTKEGKKLVQKILPGHVQGIVKRFSVLSETEQKYLAALCRRLGLQVTK